MTPTPRRYPWGSDVAGCGPDVLDPGACMSEPTVDEVTVPDLSFTTTKKDREDSRVGESLTIDIDGDEYEVVRPKDDSFALLTLAGARSATMADRIKAVTDFLDDAFTEESRMRLRDRLLDREDDFGFEDLLPIMVEIVKRWTADSAPRRARTRRTR